MSNTRPRSSQEYLNLAMDALRELDLGRARDVLGDMLFHHVGDAKAKDLRKYVAFWLEREKKVAALPSGRARCDHFLAQWSVFNEFCDNLECHDDHLLHGIRQYVFGSVLDWLALEGPAGGTPDGPTLFRAGLAMKMCGDYEGALRFLEAANHAVRNDGPTIALMADARAFLGDNDMARLLFREAFSLEPPAIPRVFLESALFEAVRNAAAADGYAGDMLAEWIPVYGYVTGLWNARRELRQQESNRLAREIYQLERDILTSLDKKPWLVPRVINKYFWLMDQYAMSRNEEGRIRELLLKIRGLNPRVHEMYTK